VPISVAAAFHTPLMEPAGAALHQALAAAGWRSPSLQVVANLTAEPYTDAAGIPASLERQLSSPVRWADSVRRLGELGCETFYELGPKKALTGMMRELAPDAHAIAVSSPEAVERLE
jgi:[acyl-carrier-protein] S-malonyltransferase